MAVEILQNIPRPRVDRTMVMGVVTMALAVVAALFFVVIVNGGLDGYPYLFLLPWIFGLAVILCIPLAIFHFQRKFSFYNPIVFAIISYFFPAFVVGGISLAAGLSNPYFLSFIQDPKHNLPLTIALTALGFSGLFLGYWLPVGRKIGELIESRLPKYDFKPTSFLLPAGVLLFLGIFNTLMAFALGLLGYQKTIEMNSYDGLIFLSTLFWIQGSFLLCYVIFWRRKFDLQAFILLGFLLSTGVSKALFSANRSGLLSIFIIFVLAYTLAGRRFTIKVGVIAGILLAVSLFLGIIYGTTFRNVKGTESQQSATQYTNSVFETLDQVGKKDNGSMTELAVSTLAERIDAVSSLAVVVSNYEQLAPYEESYGLDDNIWKDTTTFFVPRLVWPDKPVASDPRRYSDLYFDYGESSFTITPMGDLLRNYGIVGIPLGMILLGILLRAIYRTLIEDQPRSIWRATIYFMLLTAVSYESFYGSILPYLLKVGATSIVGILLIIFLAGKVEIRTK